MINKNINDKKLFKNQFIITGILVFVVVVSFFGGSYAIFMRTKEAKEYNEIKVGDIAISYVDLEEDGNTLKLNNDYPVSDEVGSNGKSFRFSVENTSSFSIEYKLVINDDNAVITSDGCSDNLLDKSNIRFKFDNDNVNTLSDIYDEEIEGYLLTEGNLNAGESNIHEIKLWIKEDADNSVLGSHFHGKVSAVLEQDTDEGINLYKMMKRSADKTTVINFSQHSGKSGTNGIYTTKKTEGNVPVYYYRGKVDNNVIFANYCWKIIRTTETGGVKIIYNGTPTADGKCNSYFIAGTETAQSGTLSMSSSTTYYYGTSYTFNETTGYYSLAGTITSGVWSDSSEFINKYTCKSTSQTGTCATLYKIKGYSSTTAATYSTLPRTINTQTGTSAFNPLYYYNAYVGYMYGAPGSSKYAEEHSNANNSSIKTYLEGTNDTDGWFNTSGLKKYQDRLEDTPFCNDRSTVDGTTNNTLGSSFGTLGNATYDTGYGALARSSYYTTSPNPTYVCPQANDKFTLRAETGNGKLKYPVGLITLDEAVFAGFNTYASNKSNYQNTSNYLYTGSTYWTISPVYYSSGLPYVGSVSSSGYVVYSYVVGDAGVRPVVSLISGTLVELGGTGTPENPYVVK